MIHLQNDFLSFCVSEHGAEMQSLSCRGVEYLWDGDPKYWTDRAPTMFPYVARLTNDSYLLDGKPYSMSIHGFALSSEFSVAAQTENSVTLLLTDSEETRRQYPFLFAFSVRYALEKNTLSVTYRVENRSQRTMPFGLGGHPGFRVPFAEGTEYSDYFLKFSVPCRPDRVGFTPEVFLSGTDTPFPLENGDTLRLRHELFDEDAIILKNMAKSVTLCCAKAPGALTVSYPQMGYLGLWHVPKTDAPYLCIEPWVTLPSRQGIVEELTCKSDLIHLASGGVYENTWTITITEGSPCWTSSP